MFGSVPDVTESFVCGYCLGPVEPRFPFCYACKRLFGPFAAPPELGRNVVPMTSVLTGTLWYSRLWTYKRGRSEYGATLGRLAGTYLAAHAARLSALLGGEPTLLTVVPSKRGIGYPNQPLARALVQEFGESLAQTLRYVGGGGRFQYTPESFAGQGVDPRGHRIVLFEDTWVTGATVVSAAGRLMANGAASVAVLPLARYVNRDYCHEDHPYRLAMAKAYDVSHWPR